MFRSFEEIEAFVLRNRRARMRIALAAAQDGPALSALVEAKRKGVARGVLIGKEDEIRSLLAELGEKAEDYRILDCQEDAACAGLAARLIHSGEADVMMKGILPTATFVRAILNHENGLVPPGGLISQAAVFPCPGEERLVVFTDCAVNIAPDLAAKRRILENVLPVTRALGMERPKVAVLSAVENVSPKIVSTMDAAKLEKETVGDCVIQGPLALDGAISRRCAEHKGIGGPVAGQADVLLMPDLCSGNVLYKSITCIAGLDVASTICGASAPVVITSRADAPGSKYRSILLSVLQAMA